MKLNCFCYIVFNCISRWYIMIKQDHIYQYEMQIKIINDRD